MLGLKLNHVSKKGPLEEWGGRINSSIALYKSALFAQGET